MKKLFSLFLIILVAAGYAFAQDAKQGASFKFEKEVHDFGNVEEGPKVEYEFVFVNNGTEPLIIQNVRASCGCTTPIWPKEPVMPGEKAVIKAVYNTKGRPGRFNKAITVTSNSSEPTKVIYIKGNVERVEQSSGIPEKKPSIIEEKKEPIRMNGNQ